MKKNLLALTFGIALSLLLGELFFAINSRLLWLPTKRLARFPALRIDAQATNHAAALFREAFPAPQRVRQCASCRDLRKLVIDYDHRCMPQRPGKGCRSRSYNQANGELIYDVEYNLDQAMRRKTIAPATASPKRTILLLGDSFTFGVGVNDDETTASSLSRLLPDDEILNAGVSGAGPNDLLKALSEGTFRGCEGSRGTEKIAVYTYLDFMAERVLAPINSYGMHGSLPPPILLKPDYSTDGDGSLRSLGTFGETRPLRNPIYSFIANREMFRFFKPFFPPLTRGDLRLIGKIFERMKEMLALRCGVSRFIVSFYPGTSNRLITAVQGKMETLDFSAIDTHQVLGDDDIIAGDQHPTALAHGLYAALLHERLSGASDSAR